jgi:hypothetical protein
VKKGFLIGMAALQLLAAVQAVELFKIPLLLRHFECHQQSHSDITFLEFLDIHYNREHATDEGHDHQSNLPFKTSHPLPFTPALLPMAGKLTADSIVFVVDTNQRPSTSYHFTFTSSYLSCIWQPPQVA